MRHILSRRRAVAGGVAFVAVAGLGGTAAVASHNSTLTASSAPAATSPSPSPTAGAGRAPGRKGAPHPKAGMRTVLGKVTSASATSLAVVTPKGVTVTFAITSATKVVTASGAAETAAQLPVGEVVEVVGHQAVRHPKASASATPTASANAATPAAPTALHITDTGWKAR